MLSSNEHGQRVQRLAAAGWQSRARLRAAVQMWTSVAGILKSVGSGGSATGVGKVPGKFIFECPLPSWRREGSAGERARGGSI